MGNASKNFPTVGVHPWCMKRHRRGIGQSGITGKAVGYCLVPDKAPKGPECLDGNGGQL